MTRILALVSIFLISACASTKYKPIDEAIQTPYQSVLLLSTVPQEEIKQQIMVSNGVNGTYMFGPLGVLIGSSIDSAINNSRAKDAETSIETMRTALSDYDVTALLTQTIEQTIDDLSIGPISRVQINQLGQDAKPEDFYQQDEDAMLSVTAKYHMTPDFETIELVLSYGVHDRTAKKFKYLNSVIYQGPLNVQSDKFMTQEAKDAKRAKIIASYEKSYNKSKKNTLLITELQKKRDRKLRLLKAKILVDERMTVDWLADNAAEVRKHLAIAIPLASNIMLKDLQGKLPRFNKTTDTTMDFAMEKIKRSHAEKAVLIDEFSSSERQLYRLSTGALVLKPSYSPFLSMFMRQ